MRPVSSAFLEVVRGSHKIFSRARILTAYQEGVSPTGTAIPIVDGSVRADAKSDVRCTVDLTTSGNRRWPSDVTDLLTPYGNELFVERGVDYGNGTIEVVSLGYFRIDSVDQDDGPDGVIRITGSDRMAGLIDGRLTVPVQFHKGTSIAEVFDTLVLEIYPSVTILFDFDANTASFVTDHIAEEDRFAFLNDIVTSRGKIMYFDYKGQLRIEDPPDPSTPVFEINSGQNGVMVVLQRELTRDGVYNAVVASGQSTDTSDAPPTAIAFDNNMSSPTYWFGRFGKVPRYFSSSFIESDDGAASAALSILRQALGLPYNITLTSVPNPALEAFDPILVSFRDGSSTHIIDSLNTPLTALSAQTLSTRTRIDLEAGEDIL